eukprot:8295365-Alexandrium_andersonii.AAC.1
MGGPVSFLAVHDTDWQQARRTPSGARDDRELGVSDQQLAREKECSRSSLAINLTSRTMLCCPDRSCGSPTTSSAEK